jgi:uncharacterized protein (DUF1501 family)
MEASKDQETVMKQNRRELLKVGLQGLAVVSLSGSMPAFLSKFAFGADAGHAGVSNDNILVVVQLSGGNDGLNTVVPVKNDLYFKARKNIGITSRTLPLSDDLALNPGMTGFKELFDAGKLAVINGCGYPQPSRSHFRSMEIWHTANPKESQPTGWLGHYLDHMARGTISPAVPNSLEAINIGSELPQALVAESAPVPSIGSTEDFRVRFDGSAENDPAAADKILRSLNAIRNDSPSLQYLSRQATNAIVTADKMRTLKGYKADANYPGDGLGRDLRTIAQLIAGNFGTKLFYCQTGGYDTHANQVYGHEQTLRQATNAINMFMKDMTAKGLAEKVTVMCFSEFGRRVVENNSNGTDHGAAGPMFLAGGKVKGGLYGSYPSLSDLDDGDLKYATDFRRVYTTLLDKWLNTDAAAVLGNKFEAMDLLA